MKLTCDTTNLQLPVTTVDALESAQSLRHYLATGGPLDYPPRHRQFLTRLLGLILDEQKVPVAECAWSGVIDDLDSMKWKYVGRTRIAWVCPRCGTHHEHDLDMRAEL